MGRREVVQPVILVCDDDPRRANRWAARIEPMPEADRYTITTLSGPDLARAIDALSVRCVTARDSNESPEHVDAANGFDEAAIVLADYDLTPDPHTLDKIRQEQGETAVDLVVDHLRGRSGERLVYLARCYSTAGFLVVVNQKFQESTFDVTLQRFANSYADLNLSQADLSNPALWVGRSDKDGEYHPWAWPSLAFADGTWQGRLDFIDDLEAPVMERLGLGAERFSAKQLDLLGELSDEGGDPSSVTFDQLVDSTAGLSPRDRQPNSSMRRAIAASVVGRWLEQVVLPGQNVLVDLPHLASRYPAVLGEAPERWVGAADKQLPTAALPEALSGICSPATSLLGRPVWAASQAREAAQAIKNNVEWPDLVFCEDTSRFVATESAKEVETDVPGPHTRRFIEHVSGVRYDPSRRVL